MIWDSLLDGLGAVLSFFYGVIPSYGVAIILLTVVVRLALLPLGIKQVRSMQAMQKLQPKVKELQRKHKGNRQKLNEELQKLYKEHQVNPLGGCLPLVLQIPVFIALYSVLRATIPAVAVPAQPISAGAVTGENTVCSPNTDPSVDGESPTQVVCDDGTGSPQSFPVSEWQDKDAGQEIEAPPSLFGCVPQTAENDEGTVDSFLCNTALGTGHISEDSELFGAIVEDRVEFLGMRLSCSPTQASSDIGIRQCAGPGTEAGGAPLIGYYGLVVLMVASTWFQQRQMQRASQGPQQAQMQLMGRIMPIFLGVISISISAGVLVYWVTTNGWQIGQQYLMLRSRTAEPMPAAKGGSAKGAGEAKSNPTKGPKGSGGGSSGDGSKSKGAGGRSARSRKKRRKR